MPVWYHNLLLYENAVLCHRYMPETSWYQDV
jgi:hypothetical protein